MLSRSKILAESARDAERLQELTEKANVSVFDRNISIALLFSQELEMKFVEEETARENYRKGIEELEEKRKEVLAEMEKAMGGYAEIEQRTKDTEVEKERLQAELIVRYEHLKKELSTFTERTRPSSRAGGRPGRYSATEEGCRARVCRHAQEGAGCGDAVAQSRVGENVEGACHS